MTVTIITRTKTKTTKIKIQTKTLIIITMIIIKIMNNLILNLFNLVLHIYPWKFPYDWFFFLTGHRSHVIQIHINVFDDDNNSITLNLNTLLDDI